MLIMYLALRHIDLWRRRVFGVLMRLPVSATQALSKRHPPSAHGLHCEDDEDADTEFDRKSSCGGGVLHLHNFFRLAISTVVHLTALAPACPPLCSEALPVCNRHACAFIAHTNE